MDEREWLADQFEANRTHLRAVAYRMLGSVSEADDAVQESWLRLNRSDTAEIENLGGWLTTVVARVSLDMLRTRKSRGEEPLGPHVPEPIVSRDDGVDPEHQALLADAVGLALIVVLETLDPAERLAFVLHDMFAVPFKEIAPIVDRSPAAARQLASRARRPQRRLRSAGRAARPGHSAAARPRRAACGRVAGDPRRTSSRRAVAQRRGGCPLRTTGARERRRWLGRGREGTAARGGRVHGRERPDRRDRRAGRPRPRAPARPDGPRRLNGRQSQRRRAIRHGSRPKRKDHIMDAPRSSPSSADLAGEIGGLSVGLGILTMTLAPFALPGLLLALLLALPAVPLLVLAGVGYLMFRILVLALRLPRRIWRRRSGRSGGADLAELDRVAVPRERGQTALRAGHTASS